MSEIFDPSDAGSAGATPEPNRPLPDPVAAREEMLKAYPDKTKKKRAKQLLVNETPDRVLGGGGLADAALTVDSDFSHKRT